MLYFILVKVILLPILFIAFFFYSPSTFSEYRVYQYIVKNKNLVTEDKSLDNKSYFVTSTLDPVSYLSYHGGNNTLKIDLLKTWVCKGSTAGKDTYCQGPETELSESKTTEVSQ